MRNRRALGAMLALALCVFIQSAYAAAVVPVVSRYRSPKNPERAVRQTTSLIVLHTTEAPAKSSLRHLSERGECHYCVTEDGTVYRIIDRHRVAFHAGTSMWNGQTDVDHFSIGIECVGYHDKSMPVAQLNGISRIVKELQGIYRIPDECVVTHSMVAYGDPNKWQKHRHRGRKRCGMLFAMPSVRRVLGLKSRMSYDPDVKAGRLAIGDPLLPKVLYGKMDTMASVYGRASIRLVPPASPSKPKAPIPAVPPKSAPAKPPVAAKPVPSKPAPPKVAPTKVRISAPQSVADLRQQGYASIGTVSKKKLPIMIAGKNWNSPDTYYTIRNKVMPGNTLNPAHVEEGMSVWRKK